MSREAWILYPDVRSGDTRHARNTLRRACRQRGWDVQERSSSRAQINTEGRWAFVLSSSDATHLYRQMHRAAVAVVSLGKTLVPIHPRIEDAIRTSSLQRLRTYSLYKAFYVDLSDSATSLVAWMEGFEEWCSAVWCEGEHDSRCLPLHVFQCDGSGLESAQGRAAFDDRHGCGASRTDSQGRRWSLKPHDFHGQPQLHVAGKPLRCGFHWDVQPANRSTLITTTSEVWKVTGYVNVYPDAAIRGGNSRYAVKVFPPRK